MNNKNTSKQYTAVSLFSGIGGIDLGFEQAGFRITYQCEIDSFCRDILTQHWPDVPRSNNIKEVLADDVSTSDVWFGGFPCQDVSVARMGPRAGLRGQRSGLFHDFARLLAEARPRVFVIENVSGLLSSHGGSDFRCVIRTLAELGYCVGWRMLNSKDFGVPQSRSRVFLVGSYRDWRGPVEILFESERRRGYAAPGAAHGTRAVSPFKESVGDPRKGPVVQRLSYCLYACSARHTGTDWSRTYVSYPKGRVRRLTPIECERLQGFPEGWTQPITFDGNLDRIDTLRYQALGNAVTVPLARWIASRIRRYLASCEQGITQFTDRCLEVPETEVKASSKDQLAIDF